MGKAPAFQLFAADFYMDTASWSVDEIGIYTRLLFYEWVNVSLPNDEKRLARIAGCSHKKFQKGWTIIKVKFFLNGEGQFQNHRMEEGRHEQAEYIEQQSEKGKKSAVKRWGKPVTTVITTVKPVLQPEGQPKGNSSSSSSSSSSSKDNLPSNESVIKRGKPQKPLVIPNWIPQETWTAFLEMRKSLKKPATEKAQQLIISDLTKFKEQGYDPVVILEKSIKNSWRDVFPPKEGANGAPKRSPQPDNFAGKQYVGSDLSKIPWANQGDEDV